MGAVGVEMEVFWDVGSVKIGKGTLLMIDDAEICTSALQTHNIGVILYCVWV